MTLFSRETYDASFETGRAIVPPPLPEGERFYPFQESGVWYMVRTLETRLPAVLCADEPGLGKTIQAIGTANVLGSAKLLVVCPASLRDEWATSIERWHLHNKGIFVDRPGASRSNRRFNTVVTSFHRAAWFSARYAPDLVIVDEVHNIKNPTAKRTAVVLGDFTKNWPGFVHRTKTIFLSGTPFPNGRPNELWPILYRCVPGVIDHTALWPFVLKYCHWYGTGPQDYRVDGARDETVTELNNRLRGSGFMLRRLKQDVLKDLPPKRFKLVCIDPQSSKQLKSIVDKLESKNVSQLGSVHGNASPEIRHDLGLALIPHAIEYVKDHFASGGGKILVFAHHLDVIAELEKGLNDFGVLKITGSTPQAKRWGICQEFQKDPSKLVFIGNQAAAEGLTLTAASDVLLVEPDYTPGGNDQRADRAHRIGQLNQVIVHYLVVKDRNGLKILYSSLKKQEDNEKLLTDNTYKL